MGEEQQQQVVPLVGCEIGIRLDLGDRAIGWVEIKATDLFGGFIPIRGLRLNYNCIQIYSVE